MPESWGLTLCWLANAVDGLIAGVMLRRRLHVRWPGFFAWTALNLAGSLLLFKLHGDRFWYNFAFWPSRVPMALALGWTLGEALGRWSGWLGRVFAAVMVLSLAVGWPGPVSKAAALFAVLISLLASYEGKNRGLALGLAINEAAWIFPRGYLPAVCTLVAQYIWLGWMRSLATPLPQDERPSRNLFQQHPARRPFKFQ